MAQSEFGNSLDLVDIKEIRDGVVLLKDGSFRHVIMVGGVNFALKSETEQTAMVQGYQNMLNALNFPFQAVIHSRKVNIDPYIEGLMKRKDVEESVIIQNQIEEYTQFIKGFVEKNAIMEKMFFVVVPFYPINLMPTQSSIASMIPFFGKKKPDAASQKKTSDDFEKSFKENVEQLTQRTEQTVQGLVDIGLDAAILDNDQLVELFYNFYNPQTVERSSPSAPSTTSQRTAATDFTIRS